MRSEFPCVVINKDIETDFMEREMSEIELGSDELASEVDVDMLKLLNKYLSIYDWPILGVNEPAAGRIFIGAMHAALDNLAARL